MAKCFRCQAETELYQGICLNCANESEPARQKPQPETGHQPQDGKAA